MVDSNVTQLSPSGQTSSSAKTYSNIPETAILLVATILGCLGNIFAITGIILFRKFRKSSTAFICHQCFLDCIKCLYNFLYGYNLLHESEVPVCSAVGASYVFFVTVSAYNLLAIVVNEEVELHRPSKQRESNHYCVIFGVAILWFSCILVDMGVAFLPKEPEYIHGVGSCIFSYGTPSNFILHLLWITLVSIAIFISFFHFLSMYCQIRFSSKSIKRALLNNSILREVYSCDSSDEQEQTMVRRHQNNKLYTYLYLRRITVLMYMVLCFFLCWYPLFILTLADYKFKQPKQAYRILTILAWCHPATTPIFTFRIMYDMSSKDGLMRKIYANVYPMMHFYRNPADHPMICNNWEPKPDGITNKHFSDDKDGDQFHNSDDHPERETLLRVTIESEPGDNIVTMETPVTIETWDSSPTSPGRLHKNTHLQTDNEKDDC